MKNRCVFLLALSLLNVACSNSVIDKNHDERITMPAFNGKSVDMTRFENVPAGEERRIKNMVAVLQKKMSRDYPAGQTKRDAHPKTLACLRAEFIVEPNIPPELKAGIFALPQTYPAWIRISSSSGKIQSDKVKDLRGLPTNRPGFGEVNDGAADADAFARAPGCPLVGWLQRNQRMAL